MLRRNFFRTVLGGLASLVPIKFARAKETGVPVSRFITVPVSLYPGHHIPYTSVLECLGHVNDSYIRLGGRLFEPETLKLIGFNYCRFKDEAYLMFDYIHCGHNKWWSEITNRYEDLHYLADYTKVYTPCDLKGLLGRMVIDQSRPIKGLPTT